jgi:hypothetical protein
VANSDQAVEKRKPASKPSTTHSTDRVARRVGIKGVNISPDEHVQLYAQARYLPLKFREKSGLRICFTTYFQDPFVARERPDEGFDKEVYVPWEPGLTDGPTSARFAIVDYNADTGTLEPPAKWDETRQRFVSQNGETLDEKAASTFAFHQVNVWVLLQRALEFFEDASALGRTIPWGFEGNRLIVVPHAGYGENAFYDRRSKSLQFYYFGSEESTVYTCLSTDIVCHEFGHAVLDGVRPLLNESTSVETAAFHEFIGDLSAILLTLRNNSLRRREADRARGDFSQATDISSIAEEFGHAVEGRPYLRTALNPKKMKDVASETDPHSMSEVLTGAMFDILKCLGNHYLSNPDDEASGSKPKSPKAAFWYAADRMQRMAVQPLDLLPPVEVNFRDYALAVCRSQKLADPIDPHDYYGMMINVFVSRGVLTETDSRRLREPRYLHERLELSVPHNIDDLSRSRAAAYRFLDDNREDLLIPMNRDFVVADLYDAKKTARQRLPLPRQIILQYVWREEIPLNGPQFGKFNGRIATMLCGGTLVFDENGTVQSLTRKPGSETYGGKRQRGGKSAEKWQAASHEGRERRQAMLDNIATQIAAGRVGTVSGFSKGLLGSQVPPVVAEMDGDEVVRFQLSSHMHLSGERSEEEAEDSGGRQWQISC